MKRGVVFALVIGVCVALGWFSRAALEPSRPQAMIAMFREYCLPFRQGQQVNPTGLEEQILTPGERYWMDAKRGFVLSIDQQHCDITDLLTPLPQTDLPELNASIDAMIEQDFPELYQADTDAMWHLFRLWENHRPPAPNRWGISLIRWSADPLPNGGSTTTLSLFRPSS